MCIRDSLTEVAIFVSGRWRASARPAPGFSSWTPPLLLSTSAMPQQGGVLVGVLPPPGAVTRCLSAATFACLQFLRFCLRSALLVSFPQLCRFSLCLGPPCPDLSSTSPFRIYTLALCRLLRIHPAAATLRTHNATGVAKNNPWQLFPAQTSKMAENQGSCCPG